MRVQRAIESGLRAAERGAPIVRPLRAPRVVVHRIARPGTDAAATVVAPLVAPLVATEAVQRLDATAPESAATRPVGATPSDRRGLLVLTDAGSEPEYRRDAEASAVCAQDGASYFFSGVDTSVWTPDRSGPYAITSRS